MISSPNEVEQTAISIANWINYNGRPFVLTTDGDRKLYLTVLTEEQMMALNGLAEATPVENKTEEGQA